MRCARTPARGVAVQQVVAFQELPRVARPHLGRRRAHPVVQRLEDADALQVLTRAHGRAASGPRQPRRRGLGRPLADHVARHHERLLRPLRREGAQRVPHCNLDVLRQVGVHGGASWRTGTPARVRGRHVLVRERARGRHLRRDGDRGRRHGRRRRRALRLGAAAAAEVNPPLRLGGRLGRRLGLGLGRGRLGLGLGLVLPWARAREPPRARVRARVCSSLGLGRARAPSVSGSAALMESEVATSSSEVPTPCASMSSSTGGTGGSSDMACGLLAGVPAVRACVCRARVCVVDFCFRTPFAFSPTLR